MMTAKRRAPAPYPRLLNASIGLERGHYRTHADAREWTKGCMQISSTEGRRTSRGAAPAQNPRADAQANARPNQQQQSNNCHGHRHNYVAYQGRWDVGSSHKLKRGRESTP
jgi:hypothetical protein